MAVTSKRGTSSLEIDRLVDDALARKEEMDNEETGSHDEVRFDALAETLDRKLADDDAIESEPAHDATTGDAGEPEPVPPATLDAILDAVDMESKEKMHSTLQDDQRNLTTTVNPLIRMKAERTKKQYKGYLPFCFALMGIGLVWLIIGICTKGAYPIPFFGTWNIAWPAFMMIFGGLLFLDWR